MTHTSNIIRTSFLTISILFAAGCAIEDAECHECAVDVGDAEFALAGTGSADPSNAQEELGTEGQTCTDGREWYLPGERFPAVDGCNTCTCEPDGEIACTERLCLEKQGDDRAVEDWGDADPITCTVGRETYRPGAQFPANDGCNTCTCMPDGRVACTEKACLPETRGDEEGNGQRRGSACHTVEEPHLDYRFTSPATCDVARFSCPANSRYFSNDCGCGCEIRR